MFCKVIAKIISLDLLLTFLFLFARTGNCSVLAVGSEFLKEVFDNRFHYDIIL